MKSDQTTGAAGGVDVDTQFKELLRPPGTAWPTVILFFVCLGGLGLVSYFGVMGQIPFWVCTIVNSIFSFLMFSVAHDATHNAISRTKWLNDTLGHIGLMFFGPFSPLPVARWIHIQHHRFTNDPELDPDAYAHKSDWLTPLRWMNFDYYYTQYFLKHGGKQVKRHAVHLIVHFLVVLGAIGFGVWMGYGLELLMLWLLPTRINSFLFELMFVYLPHGPFETKAQDDPFKATSIRQGWEVLLTPLMAYQNYHLAHHLYPTAPFYNNIKIWNLKLEEHMSKDPAICSAFERWPEGSKMGRTATI
jgi:fatty acid desaturase